MATYVFGFTEVLNGKVEEDTFDASSDTDAWDQFENAHPDYYSVEYIKYPDGAIGIRPKRPPGHNSN